VAGMKVRVGSVHEDQHHYPVIITVSHQFSDLYCLVRQAGVELASGFTTGKYPGNAPCRTRPFLTVGRRDAAGERTGRYSQRVSKGRVRHGASRSYEATSAF
jgi:hypothetical protein